MENDSPIRSASRTRHIVQFQVIRGPDEMTGTRNMGGATMWFFALDSEGQMWRGTAAESAQPVWSKLSGPLDVVVTLP